MAGHPGYWREPDGVAVPAHEAEQLWATHALDVLRDVASRFGELVDYAELSAHVQERSQVRTRVPVMTWIGGVLRRVMQTTRAAGEPPLSVLVIPKRVDSAEAAWSTARMQCYRRYCADIPEELPIVRATGSGTSVGGRPSSAPAGRTRSSSGTTRAKAPSRPASRLDAPPALCPRCFLALPATGVCDNCA